jgi:hypothetical protein
MERDYFADDDDPGATIHGRRVVSASVAQRQADAVMARLRGERAMARRARLRESRIVGRRPWRDPDPQD